MTDILFDLERKIFMLVADGLTWLYNPNKLGLAETGKSIGETQAEAKKPEPEKITLAEPQPTPTPPTKTYPPLTPVDRTVGQLTQASSTPNVAQPTQPAILGITTR
jgi:hypothetical protein